MSTTSLQFLKDLLTLVGTLGGGFWILFQYQRNSQASRASLKREQALVAKREIENPMSLPEVKAALRMIDWRSGVIEAPSAGGAVKEIRFDNKLFRKALTHHKDAVHGEETSFPGETMNAEQAAEKDKFASDSREIKDIFDSFLSRLDSVDSLIENDVISKELFWSHFSYWLKRMAENRKLDDGHTFANERCHSALWGYIRGYEFSGVINLFGRYDLLVHSKRPDAVGPNS